MKENKMKRVAVFAGRPTNGTPFPSENKMVWKEICRVIDETVESMVSKDFRIVIPIWNKFDLEFLRAAERHKVPVDFVLPTKSWGETRLPKFATDLVKRMKNTQGNCVYIVEGGAFRDRLSRALHGSDIAIVFKDTVGIEDLYPELYKFVGQGKVLRPFAVDKMRFHSEEEGMQVLHAADSSSLEEEFNVSKDSIAAVTSEKQES